MKMMEKRTVTARSLPGFVFIYFLIVLMLFTGTIAFSVATTAQRQVDYQVKNIRDRFVQSQKEIVKAEVERVAVRARELRESGLGHMKDALEERIATASTLARTSTVSWLKTVLTTLTYEKTRCLLLGSG